MLSNLNVNARCDAPFPQVDKRYQRDIREDLKKALDLLIEFKMELEKLHPECTLIVERMVQLPSQYR